MMSAAIIITEAALGVAVTVETFTAMLSPVLAQRELADPDTTVN